MHSMSASTAFGDAYVMFLTVPCIHRMLLMHAACDAPCESVRACCRSICCTTCLYTTPKGQSCVMPHRAYTPRFKIPGTPQTDTKRTENMTISSSLAESVDMLCRMVLTDTPNRHCLCTQPKTMQQHSNIESTAENNM